MTGVLGALIAAYKAAAAASSGAGYFTGGRAVSFTNRIDKIAFPGDTKTTLSATLTTAIATMASMADSGTAGYIGGGTPDGGTTYVSTIDKIAFAADTKSTLSATLTTQTWNLGATANSGVSGYFAGGGTSGGVVSRIDKIAFPSDTKSTLSATLPAATWQFNQGMANSGVAGYFPNSSIGTYKLVFSTETTSTIAITYNGNRTGAMANSGTAGYIGGASAPTSAIIKIAFPAETGSTLSATLTTARLDAAGMANSGTAGYFGGGYDTNYISGIDKIAFPGDTKTTLSATLTSAIFSLSAMANEITVSGSSNRAGYFGGGYDGNIGDEIARIDKISFPADTKSTLSAVLTSKIEQLAAMANSGVAGYFAGGTPDLGLTTLARIDKITFPGDTKSTLSATLTTGGAQLASGMANSGTAGYIAGGIDNSGTVLSRIDKITFAADTKSTLTPTLTVAKYATSAMANSGTAGYISGGNNSAGTPISGIDKITFSGDTKSTLSATLTTATAFTAAMANSGVAGYVGGGVDSGGFISRIDKITFSADTKSTLTATLTAAVAEFAAMSNSGTAGYFGGGNSGTGGLSRIDKITFSADTKSTLSATLTTPITSPAGMANG